MTEGPLLWSGLCGTEGFKPPGKGLRAIKPAPQHKTKKPRILPSRSVCWAARPARLGTVSGLARTGVEQGGTIYFYCII